MRRALVALFIALLAASPAQAQLVSPRDLTSAPVDTSSFATKAEIAAVQAAMPSTANLATTASVAALAATIPVPASAAPPAVVDNNSGVLGTAGVYALASHTHPSKARKGRVTIPVAGVLDVTFSPVFTTGTPVCSVTAETTSGDTNVVNAQIDGAPTVNGMRIRITRTAISVVSLIGLSVLSVPTQIATPAHYICLEP